MDPGLDTARPPWLKVRLQDWEKYQRTEETVQTHGLNTVCFSAHCPNIGECWGHGTATLMLLGNVCTRRCGFCAVLSGKPPAFDPNEPLRVAEAVKEMGLRFAVLTSVARDDLADGGAWVFAESIREIRRLCPGVGVEVLIPDLQGRTNDEVGEAFRDLRACGVQMLTVGQYLCPDDEHLPVERHATPAEFEKLGSLARELGFRHVESAPLVRSSYHAANAPLL
ncbi:MAG: radical SAM protein [Planctomycetota bacterium]